MKIYARIQNGVVVELFESNGDITKMFHSSLFWVDASEAIHVGDLYEGGEFIRPVALVPEPTVPQSVSRFKALMALHNIGLLNAVEAIMSDPATPFKYRLAFREAQTFDRASETVAVIWSQLGKPLGELDDLFVAAEQIAI